MAELKEFRLPDIGDFESVDVVEVLVAVGDEVEKDASLIVLESDKASMEVPAPFAGTVRELRVEVGAQVSEGDVIAVLEPADGPATPGDAAEAKPDDAAEAKPDNAADHDATSGGDPDGDASDSETRAAPPTNAPDAADAPDRTSTDAPTEARSEAPAPAAASATGPAAKRPVADATAPTPEPAPARAPNAHASPSVRGLARELGVDLELVPPSGRKGRITRDDVQSYVKAALRQGTGGGVPIAGVKVAAPVEVDYSKFGDTEIQPLNKVRRVASANLHRSWVTVPHVTQFDEADITDLDAFRKSQKKAAEQHGVKLTFLPFLIQACARALKEFPHFNASLDHTGENLVVKRYCNIGVAVDTDHGLVVPVVRDADRKGLFELAGELEALSERARSRRMKPGDLQGGSFSISSLGGIGGTFFTPIVNHPEVAILGVSRMEWKPVHREGEFVPRLILPLSLSYDHRVIDGADAVRFTRRLAELLSDLRLLLI